jgi:hypothetical protein
MAAHECATLRPERPSEGLPPETRGLRQEMQGLRSEATAHVRTFVLASVASVLTTASLAFAAARFA